MQLLQILNTKLLVLPEPQVGIGRGENGPLALLKAVLPDARINCELCQRKDLTVDYCLFLFPESTQIAQTVASF